MRILVTGGAGFIGSHLVEKLIDLGHEVKVADNLIFSSERNLEKVKERINFLREDILSENMKSYMENCDAIFHLAAVSHPQLCDKNMDETFRSNIEGTFNVLRYAAVNGVRKVIFTSSALLYGNPSTFPIKESHPISIYNAYTLSKRVGELICDFFIKKYNLGVIYFRLFNTYGPRQMPNFFIPKVILESLRNGRVEIFSEKPRRDFIYVGDVVDALVKALESDFVGGPINLGSGVETSVGEIARLITSKLDAELIVLNRDVDGPMRMVCDNSMARKLLEWEPKITLEEGIESTIEWYRVNKNYFDTLPINNGERKERS